VPARGDSIRSAPVRARGHACRLQIEDVEDDDVDESGLEARHIELGRSTAGAKAVTSLRENNGDLVQAVMSCL
jgi:NACalpha-BTF3-like transcription factor